MSAVLMPPDSLPRSDQIAWGLGDRHDHNYRADIFKKFPYVIANALARRYVDKWHIAGRREANLSILDYAGKRDTPHHRLVKLALSDERCSGQLIPDTLLSPFS